MNLERLESLVGLDVLKKIKNLNILIVGIGGVGGYTLESLVRCGIENITIIDYDKVDSSNLNRQIISNLNNIGQLKVDVARKRYTNINDKLNLKTMSIFLDKDNIDSINICQFDYVVDACDSVETKALLMGVCVSKNIKIISSMGTAKKMDATKLSITTLDKTNYDKLAKKLRSVVPKNIQRKIKVVSSTEQVKDINVLGSNSFVPGTSGLLITNYIINDVANS